MSVRDESSGFWTFMETVAEIGAALLLSLLAAPQSSGRRRVFSGANGDDECVFQLQNDTITLYNNSQTDSCCCSFTKTDNEGNATVQFVVVDPGSSAEVTGLFTTFEDGICQIVTYPYDGAQNPNKLPKRYAFMIAALATGSTVTLGLGAMTLAFSLNRIHVQNNTPFIFNFSVRGIFMNFTVQSGGNARANGATDFALPQSPVPPDPQPTGRVNFQVLADKI